MCVPIMRLPIQQGIGFTLVDKDHNLPADNGNWSSTIDYKTAYLKAWGIKS
jgi:ribose transport system substrate-binding protein